MKLFNNLPGLLLAMVVTVPVFAIEPIDTGQSESLPLYLHGIAIPAEYVTLSPSVSGVLTDIKVKEGDVVKKGQRLAVVDDRVAKAAAEVANIQARSEAGVRQAKVNLHVIATRMKRLREVVARGAGSSFELDEANAEYEQARAAYEVEVERQAQAHEQWKLAQAQLEQHYIVAPFDGRITRLHCKVGQLLVPQVDVMTIGNLSELEVELFVPSSIYSQLNPGQVYKLAAERPVGETRMAQLKSVSPMIDSTMDAVRCIFSINNQDGKLPGGFVARLTDGELEELRISSQKSELALPEEEELAGK